MKKSVLSVKNLYKRFPGVLALNNVSIDLYEKEILSIIGENGAGKSTLMKVLSGIYTDYDGSILVNGEEVKFTCPMDSKKAGIEMIYQELNVEYDLSVAENIFLGNMIKKKNGVLDWDAMYSKAQEVMKRMGIDIDPKLHLRSLNVSMQQLVCIAKALVREPKILILDEPTAALTEGETRTLINILYKLKEDGISCIYISHKLDEVFEISDRIIVMRDACYISEYEKKDLVASAVIEDMVGKSINNMYPIEPREIGDVILRAEHIQVKHQYAYNKNIIDDVSFEIRKGEIVGLAGLVGSGRSELMKAIFGAIPMVKGEVYLDGEKITVKNTRDAITYGIGYLTEERKVDGYVGAMDIRQNMTLSILNDISSRGVLNKKVETEKVQKYFDFLKIKAPSIYTNIMNLSGGNQQKVILAKSLLTNMKVLLLDEPTRGIDIGAKTEIYRIMNDLAKDGMTILVVSSELPELLAVSDRLLVLAKGRIIGEVKRGEMDEKELVHMISQV